MLENHYDIPYKAHCKHEFVISAQDKMEQYGVHASDISKALIDRGYHPPTMYFPLIVKEALMVEPTETESKNTLDDFIQSMIEIAQLCKSDAESLKKAPVTTPVGRLDETLAARKPKLNFLSRD
jgi:glycine dehydrogenase subunit 2